MRRVKDSVRSAGRRRRVPGVEGLESRQLLTAAVLGQFPAAPLAMTWAPDGNLWFVSIKSLGADNLATPVDEIGAFNPTNGFIGHLAVPSTTTITGLAVGPDGNLWFTETGANKIGEVNLKTLAVTEYPVPTAGAAPWGIVTGPDGGVWFTENGVGKLGRIDPTTRAITEYLLPQIGSGPASITVGPNHHLWFIETAGSKVGAGTNGQKIGEFDPATKTLVGEYLDQIQGMDDVSSITSGPGGLLWFTETSANLFAAIASIDPVSHAFTYYQAGRQAPYFIAPLQITTGPDGNLYFTAINIAPGAVGYTDLIGELNATTHAITASPVPNELTTDLLRVAVAPRGIVTGPDGNLWFAGLGNIDKAVIVAPTVGSISVTVASDLYGTGLPGSGGPLAGHTVYIDLNGDGKFDAGDASAVTYVDGSAQFLALPPGAHTVGLVTYPGDFATSPGGAAQTVNVVADQFTAIGFSVAQTSGILPLALTPDPFGTGNTDVTSAEVIGLFRTILNRAPSATELNAYDVYIRGPGSLQSAASILLHSDEYEGYLVAIDYANILNHTATPAEVAAWVKIIDDNHLSAEQAAYYFMTSDAFNTAHADNGSFVDAVYQEVLGRHAAAHEVAAWQAQFTAGTSRSAMVNAMIHSTFAAQRAAQGLATTFWAAPLSPADEAYVVNYLVGGGTIADQAAAFAALPGFINRANATVG